ncbi:hypothetical protein C8R46DRAFT_1201720 [Mycena filopes]|nr:hypothetical protein C8R46DRAFT_1201720 [Mycena filopes]
MKLGDITPGAGQLLGLECTGHSQKMQTLLTAAFEYDKHLADLHDNTFLHAMSDIRKISPTTVPAAADKELVKRIARSQEWMIALWLRLKNDTAAPWAFKYMRNMSRDRIGILAGAIGFCAALEDDRTIRLTGVTIALIGGTIYSLLPSRNDIGTRNMFERTFAAIIKLTADLLGALSVALGKLEEDPGSAQKMWMSYDDQIYSGLQKMAISVEMLRVIREEDKEDA